MGVAAIADGCCDCKHGSIGGVATAPSEFPAIRMGVASGWEWLIQLSEQLS